MSSSEVNPSRRYAKSGAVALVLAAFSTLPSTAGAQCSCPGGTDAWGNPVDPELVECGTTVCGVDQTMYECVGSDWSPIPGSVCNDPTTPSSTIYVADCGSGGSGTAADPYCDLQDAIDAAADGDVIQIAAGTYTGRSEPFIDPTCGNCALGDACWPFRQSIPVTWGFHVFGKSLTLRGTSRTGTVLDTGASYGLLFQYAGDSRVENLTVTGGVVSSKVEATDAAIVARYTQLTVDGVDVVDNGNLVDHPGVPGCLGPFKKGIAGIVGREGATLTVQNSNILRNSWDCITLYQSDPAVGLTAYATIVDNLIGDSVHPGRGDGVGVTHDAGALILRNVVRGTVKGIGAFGRSDVTARNNVLHSLRWWGLHSNTDARMLAYNNVVDLNGAGYEGILSSGPTSEFYNNIVLGDGIGPGSIVDDGLAGTAGSFGYKNSPPLRSRVILYALLRKWLTLQDLAPYPGPMWNAQAHPSTTPGVCSMFTWPPRGLGAWTLVRAHLVPQAGGPAAGQSSSSSPGQAPAGRRAGRPP